MDTITQLSQISIDELHRIRHTLCERYGVGRRGNILEIAFGVAEKGRNLDLRRRDSICFYVRDKRMPRAKRDRIPTIESIRIKRGGQYMVVCLTTDVIRIRRSWIRLTGRSIRHVSRRSRATAGCIVAWRIEPDQHFSWGVMTVGHLFAHLKSVPESAANVRVRISHSPGRRGDREIAGTLLARTHKGDGSRTDAALVQVQRSHLVAGRVLPSNASPDAQQVRGVASLQSDQLSPGVTVPDDSPIAFSVTRFYPVFNLISAIGPLDHVLDVQSETDHAFAPGRSGAMWIIARQGSCLQFAGWRIPGQPSRDYQIGSGQSLAKILGWARDAIARLAGSGRSVVDLRLVRHL